MTLNTRDIVMIALFAALTAALGLFPPITLPIAGGVPITAQSMGCMLAGALAGAKRGGLALALFALLVAIGLPLMAGGRGGFGLFLTPSGGVIIGFAAAAFVIGWLFGRHSGEMSLVTSIIYIAIGGIGVVYLFGIPWWAFTAKQSIAVVAGKCLVFLPGDAIKVVLAALIARGVRRAYPGL
ncbi:biotin transporter BioY [Cognatishimia sp.]|uniref:biotin transporter BioY n=1 Tax=Cognatishimia sp. TaxID=2211648 RepID=UPI003514175B